jgi:hypothetical protein
MGVKNTSFFRFEKYKFNFFQKDLKIYFKNEKFKDLKFCYFIINLSH